MKLTRKKKQIAISENLVNAHALAKALAYSLQIVKENVGLLEDDTLKEAIKAAKSALKNLTDRDTINQQLNLYR